MIYQTIYCNHCLQTSNRTLSSKETQKISEAVLEALTKYHDQPVLYLLDLVNVALPLIHPKKKRKKYYNKMSRRYKKLMNACAALRCPSCREDHLCMPIVL